MDSKKATKFTTAAAIRAQLKLGEVVGFDEHVTTVGVDIDSIKHHLDGGDYVLYGITPKELIDLYGGLQFDFASLKAEFAIACPDVNSVLTMETRSHALEFAAMVIYTIGPESRQVKKPGTDKRWKFRMVSKVGNNPVTLVCHCVFVSTFKNTDAPNTQPKIVDNKLLLTIKQASLLALWIMESVMAICILNKTIIMTPLAGAIFSKSDIPNIAKAIGLVDGEG